MTTCIIALNCAKLGGRFTLKTELSLEQRIEYLDAIRQAQQKIQSLRTVLKKETQFNHKLNLNMQIKQLEKALAQDKQRVTGNG
jgi:flagellar biosynthesis chaperone FliJ